MIWFLKDFVTSYCKARNRNSNKSLGLHLTNNSSGKCVFMSLIAVADPSVIPLFYAKALDGKGRLALLLQDGSQNQIHYLICKMLPFIELL